MTGQHDISPGSFSASKPDASASFARLSARRLFVIGGIGLILAGMIFGDIFAVFVLHQNAARINERLLAATQAVEAHNAAAVATAFQGIGNFLENRGTKVDAHVHMIGFGYLALLLALVQPFVFWSERAQKRLAWAFLLGAVLLPVGVFLIHYVGLAGSPFTVLGWASIFADFGGVLVLLATAGELWGLCRYWRRGEVGRIADPSSRDGMLSDRSWASRALLVGGTLLVLAGFVHGAYYAGIHLYANEAKDQSLLSAIVTTAASGRPVEVAKALNDYAQLQGDKAVNIAAHAHIIEFGILAMLMALFQPYVDLSERWRRIWAEMFLAGSAILPVCVLLEMRWGLVAGGIADAGGGLVVIALGGMLAGIVRYTGRIDAADGFDAANGTMR